MFDLTLSPLNLEAGQDRRELPGLYVAVPKKPARLRVGDQLILMLSQSGSAPMAANTLQEIFARLSETYYASTGSVTSGLKAVAERLNDFLINRNLRQSRQQGGQTVGLLTMAVLRGTTLSIAHAGTQHAYLVAGGKVEHFADASGISRGLGLAKLVSLRFFQTTVEGNAGLILSSIAPARWSDAVLTAACQLDATAAHRQLAAGSVELQAGLVRIKPGKGEVRWDLPQAALHADDSAHQVEPAPARTVTRPVSMAQPAVVETPVPPKPKLEYLAQDDADEGLEDTPDAEDEPGAEDAIESAEEQDESENLSADETELEAPQETPPLGVYLSAPAPDLDRAPWEDEPQPVKAAPPPPPRDMPPATVASVAAAVPLNQPAGRLARQRLSQEHAAAAAAQQPPRPERPAQARAHAQADPPVRTAAPAPVRPVRSARKPSASAVGSARVAVGFIAGTRKAWNGLTNGLNKLLARALPDQPAEGLQISASTMLFIALAVPVIVVAVAATIYSQRGRGELQQANVLAARQYVDQATQREDLTLRRQDWNQGMALLDKADSYGESQPSSDLRSVIQRGMDDLDGVARIAFRPALSGSLGEGIKITRMVAMASDIYLLDSSQGQILRMFRSGQTYELDRAFACGPVNYGNVTVGKLLDIALLPADNIAKANVMGIDEHGNLLLCGLSDKPAVFTLPKPDSNWGKISRMIYFQNQIYVLDAVGNQIYRYSFNAGVVEGGAEFYFDTQIPKLVDVVDIAIDQEYLYLLHADGTMTSCSVVNQKTVCASPAPYGDARKGFEHAPLKFAGTNFMLMQASQPPDPSLYILDAANTSIYHFSLRKLNLQRQFRPLARADYPPSGRKASAFLVTPNRRMILIVDNQAYFGLLP